MTTLIIVDGLTQENFSPAEQFIARPGNLGRQEIGRLIGLGRSSGSGPLPRFIKAAATAARENPQQIRLVFSVDQEDGERVSDEALLELVRETARGFDILQADQGSFPWQRILNLANICGKGIPAAVNVKL